ncbi:MAG: redoxin domain-containing protein [Prevotellaceae bacterium]|nr:redoxin domain-containing protein [Prevotellaceae bacterium]
MKHTFFIFISAVFSFSLMHAKETTLSGVEKSYAGQTLTLRTYADQIVRDEQILSEVTVDTSGFFSFVIDIASPIQAFIPMDLYSGFIYLEPGEAYQVKLPGFIEKSLPQKLDPYFTPTEYLLEIEELKRGDFNFQLMEFEEAFDFYSVKHLVYGNDPDSIQKSVREMRSIFTDLDNPFQIRFKEYRFLLLENFASGVHPDSMIARLNELGVDMENPAFWDVFDSIFNDFIEKNRDSEEEYAQFRKIIEDGNAKMLFALLQNRYGITDAYLKELAAIRLISDLINVEDFDKFKVIELLRKLGGGIRTEQNRDLLTSLVEKASANMTGSPAFDFTGTDTKGKQRHLSDFIGKYMYLNFGNTQIDQTQKELNVLLRFADTYKKELVIMNIFLYDTPGQVARIAAPYKDKMIFLHVENPGLLREIYRIRNIPAYFLLDRDGNFLMTKGAEPNDELRVFLQRIISGR